MFNVKRPDVRITTTTLEQVKAVLIDSTERISWRDALTPGISFSVPNFPAQQFPGKTQWVQIITEDWTVAADELTGETLTSDTPYGSLDTSYPYSEGARVNRSTKVRAK